MVYRSMKDKFVRDFDLKIKTIVNTLTIDVADQISLGQEGLVRKGQIPLWQRFLEPPNSFVAYSTFLNDNG